MNNARAIIRPSKDGKHILVLCPIGHLVEAIDARRDFAGSMTEAELGAHAAGQPNRFDRKAAKCDGAGHK